MIVFMTRSCILEKGALIHRWSWPQSWEKAFWDCSQYLGNLALHFYGNFIHHALLLPLWNPCSCQNLAVETWTKMSLISALTGLMKSCRFWS